MLRVLIIECLLFGLFGAVLFRVLFAFIGRTWVVWAISLFVIVAISVLTTGLIDPRVAQDFGGVALAGLTPGMFQFARAVAWVLGCVLAWTVLRRRAAKGLETPGNIPPDDL
ncbi:MAG: hypothetical protein ACP5NM_00450 [Thiomonas sp.]